MVGSTSRKVGRVDAIRRSIIKPPIRPSSEKRDRVLPLKDVVESFSIVRETLPLKFAMGIKLTPELVQEMRRVEALGLNARVKFSANPGADGNVISVGDKNFKFTWSTETPVLCDLYEERQSGEGGDGLLAESGSAWRKLSVHRVLDESTQKHVKMRSVEAERKLKSRRAIVLDPQTSSVNQMKAIAVAESNKCMDFKNRKESPSKLKPETATASNTHKPTYRPGLSKTTHSTSPLSTRHQQHATLTSSITSGNIVKGHATGPDAAITHNLNKVSFSNKETKTCLGNFDPVSKHDDHVTNLVDVDKDSSLDNHETASSAANFLIPTPESQEPVVEINCYSTGHHEDRERQSKGKSKHRSDDKHCDEGPHNRNRKRLKGKSSSGFASGPINLRFGKSTNTSLPDEPPLQQLNLGPTNQNACKNNGMPLQKKGVEWHHEVGLPSERSLTRFSSEGICEKIATSNDSHDRNKELNNKPLVSSGSSRKERSNNVVTGARNVSPPDSGVPGASSKRKVLDFHIDDHAISQKRATPPRIQLHKSSVPNKVLETCSISKHAEARTSQEAISGVVSLPSNETNKLNNADLCDSGRRIDDLVIGSIGESRRRIESSSDRNIPYIKYEKNKAELKGPIKDAAQYRAYVKEYEEKYESYCSLNKILESYRDEFSNIGKDLKTYKDTDMKKYHEIMGQIKLSFCQHGAKHKRLKKIYIVLNEELKHLKQMIKDYAAPHIKRRYTAV